MAKRLTEFEIEDRILDSLRGREGVATAGDVAADTGLALEEVDQVMRQMVHQYKSHLDVDDEGNLLFRFDPSFQQRGHSPGRWWHEFKKKAWKGLTLAFKGWIMVMLVGYTVAFVALLVAFAIAGIAAAASSDSDAGGEMMLLPFYLILRVLEVMFWISLIDSTHQQRPRRMRRGHRMGRSMHGRGLFGSPGMGRRRGGGLMSRMRQKKKEKPSEPFYKKVFRYVFGPQTDSDPLAMEKAFARFVRENNGRVTAADWAAKTGSSLQAAENALTASAVRFQGDVNVTDDGVLVYTFDQLRVTSETDTDDDGKVLDPIWERPVRLAPLTGKNPKKTDRWITILNGFNLTMGAVVLGSVVSLASPVAIGLGWIPLVFSTLFFAFPLGRMVRRRFKKKKIERENERRRLIEAVYLSAEKREERAVDGQIFETSDTGDVVARQFDAEVDVNDAGDVFYRFPRVSRQLSAGEQARSQATAELVFGQTIFSSDEEEMSLEEAEMEEFDRRLARELGGEVELDFDLEWEELQQEVSEAVQS